MALKPTAVAIISTTIITVFGLIFIVYHDKKRRNDPNFMKKLKRDRKKQDKIKKMAKKEALDVAEKTIQNVLKIVSNEIFPDSSEEKERYFMNQMSAGEASIKNELVTESIAHFYKALKVYPTPLDLIKIFQQSLPENVFRMIVNIMALEQQQRQNDFYKKFPPEDVKLQFKEFTHEESGHCLISEQDFEEGDILYTETPLISTLFPQLEGIYCNFCMKVINKIVECKNCDKVAFCSTDCEVSAIRQYHQFLCTNNKLGAEQNKATVFIDTLIKEGLNYPHMIAKLFCVMVSEEVEKKKENKFSSWDHIEKLKAVEVEPTEKHAQENKIIKQLLSSKVPGIEEFLTDEIYLTLLSKLNGNAYEVNSSQPQTIKIKKSSEASRKICNGNHSAIGTSIYKITSYLKSSVNDANVEVIFDGSKIIATASKPIKKDEEIKVYYI